MRPQNSPHMLQIVFDMKDLNTNIKSLNETIKVDTLSPEVQIERLIQSYKQDQLVLVLGAGVSLDYGVPCWNDLLQNLLITTFKKEIENTSEKQALVLAKLFNQVFPLSPLMAARSLELNYRNNNLEFEEAVCNIIYQNIKTNDDTELFKEIAQFCAAPGKSPNLNSIITYNYDDILEQCINKLNIEIPFKSIFAVGQNPSFGQLPIYHVHGFLPRGDRLTEKNKITLSEYIYHQQYNDIYSWNNMVQINKFRENTCIFIGISLTDPNLRRLLDIAKTQRGSDDNQAHFIIKKRRKDTDTIETLTKILNTHKSLSNEKENTKLNIKETARYLNEVMQKFEENDASSFAINTIWVDDYDEIPLVLKKIREMNI